MKCGGSSRCVRLGCELEPWKARIAAQGVVHHATADNKTGSACVACGRSGGTGVGDGVVTRRFGTRERYLKARERDGCSTIRS